MSLRRIPNSSLMLLAAVAALSVSAQATAGPRNTPEPKKPAAYTPVIVAPNTVTAAKAAKPAALDDVQPANTHPQDESRVRLPHFVTSLFESKAKHSESTPELPLGLSFNNQAKGLILPLDENKTWGIGVGVDLSNRANSVGEVIDGKLIEFHPAMGAVLQGRF